MSPLRVSGRSHAGLVRTSNEDRYLVGVLHKGIEVRDTNLTVTDAVEEMSRLDADFLIVADGVGGSRGGDRASQSAVFSLATFIARTAACHYDPDVEQEDEFLHRLERALEYAHSVVRELANQGRAPATTLTMAMVIGARAYIAHAGDSRAYHCRNGRLRQITRDQTWANMLSDAGITEPGAARGNLSNVLLSAVGAQSMEPAIGLVDLAPGDWLLLCSDGLTKHVADDAIAQVLNASHDPDAVTSQLVNAALAGGGTDNVTVVAAMA
jgi:protein phosphatase